MADKSSANQGLIEVAASLEKLAAAIEEAPRQEKVARRVESSVDYGTLGQARPSGADPLTDFLLNN